MLKARRSPLKASNQTDSVLDKQNTHWETTFNQYPNLYGYGPSYSAKKAVQMFKNEGMNEILELGGGQGRDAVFFAKSGLKVVTLEYTKRGVDAIRRRARQKGLKSITAIKHDVRKPLPFDDKSFDACYSHMLYCMALTTTELKSLCKEVRRVLRPRGLSIYTVRDTTDRHYKRGIHRGEDMYEMDGFIVHFFSRAKIRHLAKGYKILDIEEFQEGSLPRNLFLVTLRKK